MADVTFCDIGHTGITYNEDECPLCRMQCELSEAEDSIYNLTEDKAEADKAIKVAVEDLMHRPIKDYYAKNLEKR